MINLLNFPHNLKEILEEDDFTSYTLKDLMNDIKSNMKLDDEELAAILKIDRSQVPSIENGIGLTSQIKEELKRLLTGGDA